MLTRQQINQLCFLLKVMPSAFSSSAHSHKESPEYKLLCWLREHGLAHYFEGFIHSGLILLSDVAQLELPDETIFDELEITLPGHQRRLERAGMANLYKSFKWHCS